MKQHVFPSASITRFLNDKGFVNVEWVYGKSGHKKPGSSIFLSDRAWDQRSEISSHDVENEFQKLATQITCHTVNSLNEEQSKIVSEMACIWLSRWLLKHKPCRDIKMEMGPLKAIPQGYLSLDDYRDAAEKSGLVACGSVGIIPSRFQSWPRFRRHVALLREQFRGLSWGIIRSQSAEFIVPDVSPDGIFPISPTILLIAGKPDLTADCEDVSDLNRRIKTGAREWYFGRRLTECPFPNS